MVGYGDDWGGNWGGHPPQPPTDHQLGGVQSETIDRFLDQNAPKRFSIRNHLVQRLACRAAQLRGQKSRC
jgi:hypothetical protein